MMNLNNQTVLIIGGATGMGFATAKMAEKLGGKFIVAGHNEEKNAKALSDEAESRLVDVVQPNSIAELFLSLNDLHHVFITAAPGGTGDSSEASLDITKTYIYGKFWILFMISKSAENSIDSKQREQALVQIPNI